MENLGDNVKQLREEVNNWGQPEGQEILDDLMKEVPMISSPPEQPQVSNQTPIVNLQIPPMNDPILSSPAFGSTPVRSDPDLEDMQKRVAALKTGSPANFVSQSGAQGKVQLGPVERFSSPASATLPYPRLDGHPRRITPIPVTLPILPSTTPAMVARSFRERDALQDKEKTFLRPIPEPPSKTGWLWSEVSEQWFKTPELMEKERLAGLQAAAEEEAESSI